MTVLIVFRFIRSVSRKTSFLEFAKDTREREKEVMNIDRINEKDTKRDIRFDIERERTWKNEEEARSA